MATRQAAINITRGNDVTLVLSIATSVALATAKFTAKRSASAADNDAAALKVVTTSLTGDGQITTAGPPTAVVKIVLDKTTTSNFIAPKDRFQIDPLTYVWDLEVFDGSGKATTPINGTIIATERVRTAIG
jgi:hypothetical protein